MVSFKLGLLVLFLIGFFQISLADSTGRYTYVYYLNSGSSEAVIVDVEWILRDNETFEKDITEFCGEYDRLEIPARGSISVECTLDEDTLNDLIKSDNLHYLLCQFRTSSGYTIELSPSDWKEINPKEDLGWSSTEQKFKQIGGDTPETYEISAEDCFDPRSSESAWDSVKIKLVNGGDLGVVGSLEWEYLGIENGGYQDATFMCNALLDSGDSKAVQLSSSFGGGLSLGDDLEISAGAEYIVSCGKPAIPSITRGPTKIRITFKGRAVDGEEGFPFEATLTETYGISEESFNEISEGSYSVGGTTPDAKECEGEDIACSDILICREGTPLVGNYDCTDSRGRKLPCCLDDTLAEDDPLLALEEYIFVLDLGESYGSYYQLCDSCGEGRYYDAGGECLAPDSDEIICETCLEGHWDPNFEQCCGDDGEDDNWCNSGNGACVEGVWYDDHCLDGVQNCDETDVDFGGECGKCDLNEQKYFRGIHALGLGLGYWTSDELVYCPNCKHCLDGIKNCDETGVDCGGECDACTLCDRTSRTITIGSDFETFVGGSFEELKSLGYSLETLTKGYTEEPDGELYCLYCDTCGDGECNCGETSATCSQDCPTDCTDPENAGEVIDGNLCCQVDDDCFLEGENDPCIKETCVDNICEYRKRSLCDNTECPAGEYCNSDEICVDPDDDSEVCVECIFDQSYKTIGYPWDTAADPAHWDTQTSSCCGDDEEDDNWCNEGNGACVAGSWYPDHCLDGVQDCDETSIDEGSSCSLCNLDAQEYCISSLENCESGEGIWISDESKYCSNCPHCADGVQNCDEEGIDCGGVCGPCPDCTDPENAGKVIDGDLCCQSPANCYLEGINNPCVEERCVENVCEYRRRSLCDNAECPDGQYCNSEEKCVDPDDDSEVCVECIFDQAYKTTGNYWDTGADPAHWDARKGNCCGDDEGSDNWCNTGNGACVEGSWYPDHCIDEVQDCDETSVDEGKSCHQCNIETREYCISSIENCESGDGVWSSDESKYCSNCEHCFDGVKNCDEIGVDCGRSCNPCSFCDYDSRRIYLGSDLKDFFGGSLDLLVKEGYSLETLTKGYTEEPDGELYCLYCDTCGDGECNCGEDYETCPEECPQEKGAVRVILFNDYNGDAFQNEGDSNEKEIVGVGFEVGISLEEDFDMENFGSTSVLEFDELDAGVYSLKFKNSYSNWEISAPCTDSTSCTREVSVFAGETTNVYYGATPLVNGVCESVEITKANVVYNMVCDFAKGGSPLKDSFVRLYIEQLPDVTYSGHTNSRGELLVGVVADKNEGIALVDPAVESSTGKITGNWLLGTVGITGDFKEYTVSGDSNRGLGLITVNLGSDDSDSEKEGSSKDYWYVSDCSSGCVNGGSCEEYMDNVGVGLHQFDDNYDVTSIGEYPHSLVCQGMTKLDQAQSRAGTYETEIDCDVCTVTYEYVGSLSGDESRIAEYDCPTVDVDTKTSCVVSYPLAYSDGVYGFLAVEYHLVEYDECEPEAYVEDSEVGQVCVVDEDGDEELSLDSDETTEYIKAVSCEDDRGEAEIDYEILSCGEYIQNFVRSGDSSDIEYLCFHGECYPDCNSCGEGIGCDEKECLSDIGRHCVFEEADGGLKNWLNAVLDLTGLSDNTYGECYFRGQQ